MSHFTHMKTRFQNLFYLEKALNRLNISHKQEIINDSNLSNINLVIPQSNNYDIKFCWNGQEYELVVVPIVHTTVPILPCFSLSSRACKSSVPSAVVFIVSKFSFNTSEMRE